jgi:universal stress protein A
MAELQWRKVFCPIDFSEASRAALRVAVDLARRFGAELTLFHADETSSALQAATSEPGQLGEWRREAERLGAARVTTAHAGGEPPTAIVDAARSGGHDLIVMGTHGRTGRSAALIGSVAENVVRRSTVPVLTVHAEWQGGG